MNTMKIYVRYCCLSISLSMACIFPVSLEAKTLYVNGSTGNDSVNYAANSESTPWRTIGRAAWGSTNRSSPNATEAARAGDRVLIAAGTYSAPGTDNRNDPAYNPVNSGTAGNPITFEATGTVLLTLSSSRGPVIGAWEKHYIAWKGFAINEANAPSRADTGPVVFSGSIGSTAENLTIDGNGDPGYNDNHTGIRIQYSSQIVARNNRIFNVRTSGVNHVNGCGIQIYNSYNLLLENNDISASGSGIFLKELIYASTDSNRTVYSATGTTTVRNNMIYNVTSVGIAVHRQADGQTTLIHNNIVRNSANGIRLWGFDTETYPRNVMIANNTLYGNESGLDIRSDPQPNANNKFYNNIIANSASYAVTTQAVTASGLQQARFSSQHNSYYQFNPFAYVSGDYSLSGWKSSLNQDTVASEATSTNPLFVDAANGNFRLQPGSPVLNLGVDLLDLNSNGSRVDLIPAGAYITGNEIIGLGSTSTALPPSTTPTAPMAPVNLRIQ